MGNVALSVIIPARNHQDRLAALIRQISEALQGIELELIVIDMNSSDNTVMVALNELKKQSLRGFVIQSGGGTVASALNTGVFKAEGKYITFVFMSRLYRNYLEGYLRTAEDDRADLVFALPEFENDNTRSMNERLKNSKPGTVKGTELLEALICSRVYFDFSAVLLRRDYLLQHHIKFYEDCSHGYAEAFIYNVLLCRPRISCAAVRPEREASAGAREETVSRAVCYDRIEAMLRVYDNAQLLHMEDKALLELFEYRKLPGVTMAAVDMLKKENFSYSAIKKSLRQKGYDRLLRTSALTPKSLRRRIFVWKTLPWYYRTP